MHQPARRRQQPGTGRSHRLIGGGLLRRLQARPQVLDDQRAAARHQIAQVVGQVGVVALGQRLRPYPAVVAVGDGAQQVVAQRVGAEPLRHLERVHHVAERLAHLAPVRPDQIAAYDQAVVEGAAGGLEHGGPEHRVRLENVFADQVPGAGPEAAVQVPVRVPQGGGVVDERVEPHVGHVLRVPRQRDAPRHAPARTRDRQVAERFAQHGEHLAAGCLGPDKAGVAFQVLDQPRLILLHAEEVVSLAAPFRRGGVFRQLAVHQLLVGDEPLLAHRVETLVLGGVDVAGVVETLQHLPHHRRMARLGGADKVVVGNVEPPPGAAKALADAVGERLCVGAGRGRGLIHLLAVLVGAGQKIGAVAVEAVPARQEVGDDGGVGVAEVRFGVDVVDRGGDVEGLLHDWLPRAAGDAQDTRFRLCRATQPARAPPAARRAVPLTGQPAPLAYDAPTLRPAAQRP